jgi:RNA ligase (TIGR02306 family)
MLYKVCVEEVKVYPHPDPETTSLELVGIGEQQYVVQKGLYITGDKAVAIPKNSIVKHPVFIREWGQYLQGKEGNKVGFKIMRGQESQGIVVREDLFKEITGVDLNTLELGTDVTGLLGVEKYIPEVPDEIKNTVEVYNGKPFKKDIKHDCKYASVYLDKLVQDELVTITSKLHGTQVNVLWNYDKQEQEQEQSPSLIYSSKGLWDNGLVFKEDVDNVYSKGWSNMFRTPYASVQFWDKLTSIKGFNIFDSQVQIIGEVVGVTGGFSYSYIEPTMFLYSVYIDGISVDLIKLRDLDINIVPELYRGPFDPTLTLEIANNFAQQATCPIDGKTLNEGVVISNGRHYIKVKNEKFMKKHGTVEGN